MYIEGLRISRVLLSWSQRDAFVYHLVFVYVSTVLNRTSPSTYSGHHNTCNQGTTHELHITEKSTITQEHNNIHYIIIDILFQRHIVQ
jgi:hypothetical protein